jgi:hypothetical protein
LEGGGGLGSTSDGNKEKNIRPGISRYTNQFNKPGLDMEAIEEAVQLIRRSY